jgi:hypothetical protein
MEVMTMALWRRGKTKALVKRISAKPAEPAEDLQARIDEEFAQLVRDAGAAFTERVIREGSVFPNDALGASLDDIRERLRLARGQGLW